MKRLFIGTVFALGALWQLQAQVRNEIVIPQVGEYQTLKCDFHIHTVYSDGLVWPTVRVDEAYREGLDCIALTEHLEYRPHKDIKAGHGRSWEVAQKSAKANGILLIRGSEITRPMAPGHFNAIFVEQCDSLAQTGWRESFKQAKAQNSFFFGIIQDGTASNLTPLFGGPNTPNCWIRAVCKVLRWLTERLTILKLIAGA